MKVIVALIAVVISAKAVAQEKTFDDGYAVGMCTMMALVKKEMDGKQVLARVLITMADGSGLDDIAFAKRFSRYCERALSKNE